MKNTFFVMLLCAVITPAYSQFDGLRTFKYDSLLRKQLVDQRVKSVTETQTEYKEPFFSGKVSFDTKGRAIEFLDRYGNGIRRHRSEYSSQGLLLKTITYDERDSSKITHWESLVYDDKKRLLKKVNGSYQNGKAVEYIGTETKYLPGKSKYRTEKQEFHGGKLRRSFITIDSVSGIYTYSITYEFDPDDVDAKGRRQGKKVLVQTYIKDSIMHEDHIEYDVNGRIEIADKMKSYYHKLNGSDKNSRELEYGEIKYDDAYMTYLQQHPEEYGRFITREFIKALLAGEIKGEKKVYRKNTINSAGQLIESEYYGKKIRYKYNDLGQVIEQTNLAEQITDVLSYNEKGLIIKKVSTLSRRGVPQHPSTSDYTYEYY